LTISAFYENIIFMQRKEEFSVIAPPCALEIYNSQRASSPQPGMVSYPAYSRIFSTETAIPASLCRKTAAFYVFLYIREAVAMVPRKHCGRVKRYPNYRYGPEEPWGVKSVLRRKMV
jgi:hypothetical protein